MQQMGDGDEMDFTMSMGLVPVRRVARIEDVSPAASRTAWSLWQAAEYLEQGES